MEYTLRKYQEEATEACLDILNSKKTCKELVVLCTGDGKSLVQAEVAKRLDYPLIILCPSKELLEQNSEKLTQFGVEHTICSASAGERSISKLTLATIGSIKNNTEEFKRLGIKGLLIDEGHLGVKHGSMIRKFIKKMNIKNVVGLTATPVNLVSGMDGASLKMLNRMKWKMYSDIRYVHQIKDTIKEGNWAKLKYKVINSDETLLVTNSSGSDFTEKSQKIFYKENDLTSKIVEEVQTIQKEGRKSTIIFAPSIEEAEDLYSKIPNSAIVHSKMRKKDRGYMVEAFRNLEIPVIINIGILQIGFNHPQLDSIIIAKPTQSVNLFYQIVGRGVRTHKDKEDCLIADFSGNYDRFGSVEGFTFEKIPFYGWAMLNGKEELLTDYPIQSTNRPTKDSLIASYKEEKERNSNITPQDNPVFYFGKYKGKALYDVLKENKWYLTWLADPETKFEWWGAKGKTFKKALYKALRLPQGEVKKKSNPNSTGDVKSFSETVNLTNIKTIF